MQIPAAVESVGAVKASLRASLLSVRAPRQGLQPSVGRPLVERVGVNEGRVKASFPLLRCFSVTESWLWRGPHTRPPVEQHWPRSRSAKWVLKITQRVMVKRRRYVSILQSVYVCPCHRLSLTPYRSFNPLQKIKNAHIFLWRSVVLPSVLNTVYNKITQRRNSKQVSPIKDKLEINARIQTSIP